MARPGYVFRFPEDHGAHPGFQTEWWYYTGHLTTEAGRPFGYQLTFFRRSLRPPVAAETAPPRSRWRIDELYFAHLALSDLQGSRFRFAEALSREGLGKAGAEVGRLHVWIDRWSATKAGSDDAPHRLVAEADEFGIALSLTPAKPVVIHGTQGISRKGAAPGQASHYYSQTRLSTEGALTLDGRRWAVSGESWMDHEFGSGDLGNDLIGWDWFSFQLDSGEELMLYRLRRADDQADPASSATWIGRDGRTRHIPSDAIRIEVLDRWTSPHSQATYPSRWRISIPSLHAAFEITPSLADQELRTTRSTQITYWEGAVRISGAIEAKPVSGQGYVELTGYAERYRPRL